jgi:hypothetical protein
MPAHLLDDIFGRLFITLFFASLWWSFRLHELVHEDKIDRFSDWMQIWSETWGLERRPPPNKRLWRWGQAGLFLVAQLVYLIPFYPHEAPFVFRLFLVIACFAIYGACIYYCEKKMGK